MRWLLFSIYFLALCNFAQARDCVKEVGSYLISDTSKDVLGLANCLKAEYDRLKSQSSAISPGDLRSGSGPLGVIIVPGTPSGNGGTLPGTGTNPTIMPSFQDLLRQYDIPNSNGAGGRIGGFSGSGGGAN